MVPPHLMMSLERAERPTVAVILAGGTGQRFGASLPKQLLKVSGKTILEHTLDVFEACEHIGEILVMMNADFIADAEKIVAERGYSKVTTVLPGATPARTPHEPPSRNWVIVTATSCCMMRSGHWSTTGSCGTV